MATRVPPRKKTDEASKHGLQLAKRAGDAYQEMVSYFIADVASDGGTVEAGDYRIGVAVEEAEPLWQLSGDRLELTSPPEGDNAHLEVVVTDAADGRFIPGLHVTARLRAADGSEIGSYELPFLWHPTMYHYGRNVRVPQEGDYELEVGIAVPTFARHDKTNGRRYVSGVTASVAGLHIKPGRKT